VSQGKTRHSKGGRPAGLPRAGSDVAIVPVRDGQLPLGGAEVAWETGQRTGSGRQAQQGLALLAGTGCSAAAQQLPAGFTVWGWDAGPYAPGGWAQQLAPILRTAGRIILPASPDGRDLAPRIAAELERPFLGGVVELRADTALVPRWEGAALAELPLHPYAVLTRLPNTAPAPLPAVGGATFRELSFPLAPQTPSARDAELTELLPADPATVDLSEAQRIVSGGAGLGGPERFDLLARIAEALSASLGATRLVADLGWVDPSRYIGTTGVSVNPELYVAFGVSGAVQHLTGLGDPRHIVAANTDASCPMMTRADLALICDVPELLTALAARLEVTAGV
jgi:electron transfer flavoprotein alpha subunit